MGIKIKPKQGEGTTTDAFNYVPSAVHVDHANNFSRADRNDVPDELKSHVEGATFCFTLAEVEQRLSEFDRDGEQITPGTIYLTPTRDAYLVDGYLRHAAWLLAEVRYLGEGQVWIWKVDGEGAKSKQRLETATQLFARCKKDVLNVFKAQKVAKPKSPEDWAALRRRNFSENDTRKPITPIDRAYFARRLIKAFRADDPELKEKEAKECTAADMGLTSVRSLDRYLSLLALPPSTQDKVHLGLPKGLSMSQALKKGSKTGQGTGKGERKGVKHSAIARACDNVKQRPSPKAPLDAKQLVLLAERFAGVTNDSKDKNVEEWIVWFSADKNVGKKPKQPPKTT